MTGGEIVNRCNQQPLSADIEPVYAPSSPVWIPGLGTGRGGASPEVLAEIAAAKADWAARHETQSLETSAQEDLPIPAAEDPTS